MCMEKHIEFGLNKRKKLQHNFSTCRMWERLKKLDKQLTNYRPQSVNQTCGICSILTLDQSTID